MPEDQNKTDYIEPIMRIITNIVHQIGITGLIPAFIVITYFNSSKEQKEEFFDKYILLNNSSISETFVPIILFILLIMVIQHQFYKKRLSIKDIELERVQTENKELQKIILRK